MHAQNDRCAGHHSPTSTHAPTFTQHTLAHPEGVHPPLHDLCAPGPSPCISAIIHAPRLLPCASTRIHVRPSPSRHPHLCSSTTQHTDVMTHLARPSRVAPHHLPMVLSSQATDRHTWTVPTSLPCPHTMSALSVQAAPSRLRHPSTPHTSCPHSTSRPRPTRLSCSHPASRWLHLVPVPVHTCRQPSTLGPVRSPMHHLAPISWPSFSGAVPSALILALIHVSCLCRLPSRLPEQPVSSYP